MSMMLCLKPRVRGTSESLSSAWVGLQKKKWSALITSFLFWGQSSQPPRRANGLAPLARAEEGKRQLFPLPRRAPTHTPCGFKVLDPKGTRSPKVGEIVYNVTKDITTRGDCYDSNNTLIYRIH